MCEKGTFIRFVKYNRKESSERRARRVGIYTTI